MHRGFIGCPCKYWGLGSEWWAVACRRCSRMLYVRNVPTHAECMTYNVDLPEDRNMSGIAYLQSELLACAEWAVSICIPGSQPNEQLHDQILIMWVQIIDWLSKCLPELPFNIYFLMLYWFTPLMNTITLCCFAFHLFLNDILKAGASLD